MAIAGEESVSAVSCPGTDRSNGGAVASLVQVTETTLSTAADSVRTLCSKQKKEACLLDVFSHVINELLTNHSVQILKFVSSAL